MKTKLKHIALLFFIIHVICSCNSSNNKSKTDMDVLTQTNDSLSDSVRTIYLWGAVTTWPPISPVVDSLFDTIPIDHAFATDYNPITTCDSLHYWNCLASDCHLSVDSPAINAIGTLYAQQKGNIALALRLVSSNCRGHIYGDCSGGMEPPYAAYGVCQQVANRAAYATYWQGPGSFVKPLTLPDTFPGYKMSHFFYGTYGQDYEGFKLRIDSAGGDSSFVGDNGNELEKKWLIEAKGIKYADSVWTNYQLIRAVIQVALNEYVITHQSTQKMTGQQYADNINNHMARLLQQKLVPLLGKDVYLKMFGVTPGKVIPLVDASHY